MRTRLPPNVTREKTRHGAWVFYYRVGKGSRVRLPAYGTPEFDPAYQAALRGQPVSHIRGAAAVHQGTLRWLVIEYKKSSHFRNEIGAETQKRRDSIFAGMVDKSGAVQISRITAQKIIDGRESRAATGRGHAANAYMKAIKPMFAYAKARGWIETDPCRDVDFVKTRIIGHRPWGIEDVQRFEERHPLGTMANLAMRILLFTGLRRSDAVTLGHQHIRNGIVRFRPSKTVNSSGVFVTFTALPPLLEAIEATQTGDLTLLVTERGTAFESSNSFGNWFRDRCEEAGVPSRAHGLRKTGPTLAAQAGASASELMAMWGWSTLAQAEHYTRSASKEVLGGSAASKLMAGYQTENAISRISDGSAVTARKEQ
ncbi:tyrosine-type recombinase/integrase [Devosia beringensis]|uniref:tyrosine-type recombinase/integrase n=1 Tax=Devosia beringensis TaxID=2657486 RepID=UPI00186B8E33|nr:tyrosine-type recombinase/integrase [Devosia beringensis]